MLCDRKGKEQEKQSEVPEACECFQMLSHVSGIDRRENRWKQYLKGKGPNKGGVG